MCSRTILCLFWPCQGELSSWREAAPHTILILWGHRSPYPAPSYTAIVNILLDGWEVPLTPLTVTVHGDLYRRHQSQRYDQRAPAHTLCSTPFTHAETVGWWGCPEVGGGVYKATGFTLESLGVKQQCLHCCEEVKLGGHVNILTHSEHQECIWDNFPAKLHVNIWRMQLVRVGSYTPQEKGLRGCLSSMGEMYSSAHMGKGNTWYK